MKNEIKGTFRLIPFVFPAIKSGNLIFDGAAVEDPC
jgi:hypothetical protein